MAPPDGFLALLAPAARIAERLRATSATIAIAESSTGGLAAAALLAQPGASAYFRGGAIIYTRHARTALLGITADALGTLRPSTEPYAALLAETVRARHDSTWGVGESGATGPSPNGYGDPPGHCCLGLAGPVQRTRLIRTGADDRVANMVAFTAALLDMLNEALG